MFRLYDYLSRERPAFGLTAAKPLCQFDAFATAIKASGFDDALQSELGIPPNAGIVELLDAISNRIARPMRGKPKACFSKAVKETLYMTAADAAGDDVENFKRCISEFVRREGTGRLVQGLFKLHVFNSIWWKVEDRLREAEGGESLEELWRTIELLCSAAVAHVLREWQNQQNRELLKPELACDFLLQIQSRLSELCSSKVSVARASASHDTTMRP